ncbi:hypothetical protein RHSIM_RhsimUnG0035300 [Rhododendron simsii]|uniref:Phytocyanin domain-containing protein n=1 Tax=Rhododendron simsii TaxID=118357 RepID=A0A834G305_RHOSS|nr:hypothetical protein RHSIM_RhsimUnG0035300 [Rhododendron simsii]
MCTTQDSSMPYEKYSWEMKMGLSLAQGLVLVVTVATILATSQAADTIVVGGSENWRFGFNYTAWALKHGPFFVNDILVFKYDPPSETTRPHNVYLLPNLGSFIKCDFEGAKLLANATQGSGSGFEYALMNPWRPLYFASSEGNGADCKDGLMKFFVVPLPRIGN